MESIISPLLCKQVVIEQWSLLVCLRDQGPFLMPSVANRLPSHGTADHTPNEEQGSTGNEGVVYDEISESTRRQGKADDTTTTRPSNIELKPNTAYGPGNIELKENAAYQVGRGN